MANENRSRAVVHVGLPKTGSTTIQRFLALNRHVLAQRGFHADPPLLTRVSHLEYGLAALAAARLPVQDPMTCNYLGFGGPADLRALAQDVTRRLDAMLAARTGTTLISSEHLGLWLQSPRRRQALDTWLRARFDKVRYILFVRPQAELVLSSYSESIKLGSSRTLDEFVRDYDEIDVAAILGGWRSQFGTRLAAAALPAVGPALVHRYCKLAGLDPTGMTFPPPSNPALTAPAARFLRRANALIGRDIDRNRAQRAAFAVLRRTATTLWRKSPPLRLSAEQAAIIAARYPDGAAPLTTENPAKSAPDRGR